EASGVLVFGFCALNLFGIWCLEFGALMKRLDRSLLLALLVSAAIILPRSFLISRAHSECIDDQYHLVRGVGFWTGQLATTRFNDPPLGEAISALPLVLSGCRPQGKAGLVLYGQRLRPETL